MPAVLTSRTSRCSRTQQDDGSPPVARLVFQPALGRVGRRGRGERRRRHRAAHRRQSFSRRQQDQLEILSDLEQMRDPPEAGEVRRELALGTAGRGRVRHPVQSLHPQPHHRRDRPARGRQEHHGVDRDRRQEPADGSPAGGDQRHRRPIRPAGHDVRQDGGEVPEGLRRSGSGPGRRAGPRPCRRARTAPRSTRRSASTGSRCTASGRGSEEAVLHAHDESTHYIGSASARARPGRMRHPPAAHHREAGRERHRHPDSAATPRHILSPPTGGKYSGA